MHRVILLGASNLARSLPLLCEQVRTGLSGPIEAFAAAGHGRSYGTWSRFLFRDLPGIVECGLWDELARRCGQKPATDTNRSLDDRRTIAALPHSDAHNRMHALVTDVGNDLAYEVEVGQIVQWVEWCLTRLQEYAADVIVTLPPLASLKTLSRWRYGLLRTLFFPSNRTPLREMLARAQSLSDRLRAVGDEFSAAVVEPCRDWYGFDPIHIRRSRRQAVWREILSHWQGYDPESGAGLSRGARRAIRRARPEQRVFFGRRQNQRQPAVDLDEWRLFLY